MKRRGSTVREPHCGGVAPPVLSRTGQLGLVILLVVFCVFVFLRVR
jgi:hypothetical protein